MSTFDRRRTRAEAQPFVRDLEQMCREIVAGGGLLGGDPNAQVLVCGTWRREVDDIGDVDVLIATEIPFGQLQWPEWVHPTMKKAYGWLQFGTERMMLDAWRCPPDSVGPMALFLTGPPELNVFMRQEATRQGYVLNQYGLWTIDPDAKGKLIPGERVDTPSTKCNEEEIMRLLGLTWLTPQQRQSWSDHWRRSKR